jgi:hypothetical protein
VAGADAHFAQRQRDRDAAAGDQARLAGVEQRRQARLAAAGSAAERGGGQDRYGRDLRTGELGGNHAGV